MRAEVVPVGGARSAGSGCGACGRRRGLAGPLPATRGRREACGAWPGFETTRRAKLVARTASGRAGLAPPGSVVVEVPPGSVVVKVSPGSEVVKVLRGSVVAKMPRGSEVGRNSASGGVEVEEGD